MIDNNSEYDRRFMLRCIALARQAKKLGEFPFVSIVVRDGEIISEAINEVSRTRDLNSSCGIDFDFAGAARDRHDAIARLRHLHHRRALPDVFLRHKGSQNQPCCLCLGVAPDGRRVAMEHFGGRGRFPRHTGDFRPPAAGCRGGRFGCRRRGRLARRSSARLDRNQPARLLYLRKPGARRLSRKRPAASWRVPGNVAQFARPRRSADAAIVGSCETLVSGVQRTLRQGQRQSDAFLPFAKTPLFRRHRAEGLATALGRRSRRDIGTFIETIYNSQRLHPALGTQPPVEFEAELSQVRNHQTNI